MESARELSDELVAVNRTSPETIRTLVDAGVRALTHMSLEASYGFFDAAQRLSPIPPYRPDASARPSGHLASLEGAYPNVSVTTLGMLTAQYLRDLPSLDDQTGRLREQKIGHVYRTAVRSSEFDDAGFQILVAAGLDERLLPHR